MGNAGATPRSRGNGGEMGESSMEGGGQGGGDLGDEEGGETETE